jgi:nocturnin
MIQVLRVIETGQEFCVATTHLKAKEGALLATIRHEEGLDLVSFVKSCAGDRPVVICGDFNANPSEPVYAAMMRSTLKLGSAYASGQRFESRTKTSKLTNNELINNEL